MVVGYFNELSSHFPGENDTQRSSCYRVYGTTYEPRTFEIQSRITTNGSNVTASRSKWGMAWQEQVVASFQYACHTFCNNCWNSTGTSVTISGFQASIQIRSFETLLSEVTDVNPLNAELNPICYLLTLLAHHFLHVSRIRVKLLTFRLLMSYIYWAPILDVSRSHTTTQHSR